MEYILTIEDNKVTSDEISEALRNIAGTKVTAAYDGVQAYQKSRNQKFLCIISAYNIPKISGLQLISTLKETNTNSETPLIIYTANTLAAKAECKGIKNIYFINSPIQMSKLKVLVNEIIKYGKPQKKFQLDVHFINPFIDACLETIKNTAELVTVNPDSPLLLKPKENLDIDISGILEVESPYFEGSVAISFSDDVYKKILSKITFEDVKNIDASNQDGIAELLNIIFGKTKSATREKGFQMERAAPSVMRGHQHRIYQNSKIPVLIIPIISEIGKFYVQICVKAI